MLKLRQILCPTDFSELSYEALRVAGHLASRFKAHLDLLHVVAPDQPMNPLLATHREASDTISKSSIAEDKPQTLATASQELHKVAAEQVALPHQVVPRSLTRLGKSATEIVIVAREEGSDLIVMGTHGLTGWRHMILGSVAEAVVREAPCPVLTIRQSGEETDFCVEMPRKILCPTDYSEASYVGLSMAVELACEFGAELILMHAIEPFTGYSGLILEPDEIEAFTISDATIRLSEVLRDKVPASVQSRVLAIWGGAAEAIVNAARTENVDLVVIATHGVTGWRHLLLGSVAETVVRAAACPVLTVPVQRAEAVPAEPATCATPITVDAPA